LRQTDTEIQRAEDHLLRIRIAGLSLVGAQMTLEVLREGKRELLLSGSLGAAAEAAKSAYR
jgi:hypothetical protein